LSKWTSPFQGAPRSNSYWITYTPASLPGDILLILLTCCRTPGFVPRGPGRGHLRQSWLDRKGHARLVEDKTKNKRGIEQDQDDVDFKRVAWGPLLDLFRAVVSGKKGNPLKPHLPPAPPNLPLLKKEDGGTLPESFLDSFSPTAFFPWGKVPGRSTHVLIPLHTCHQREGLPPQR